MATIEVTNFHRTDHDFTLTLIHVRNESTNSYSPWCEWIKLNKYKVKFRFLVETNYYRKLYCYAERETCDTDNGILNGLRISVKMDDLDIQTYITHYNIEKRVAVLDGISCTITVSDTQSNCDFKTMYDDETLLDFKLAVKGSNEGSGEESVGFHRFVLAAWSPVMMKMFSNSWKEKNEGVLELPVKLEVIKAFKKYVYTEELPEDKETLLALVELGSYYMNSKLEISACKVVLKLIKPSEIWETIEYAVMKKTYNLSRLLILKVHDTEIHDMNKVLDAITDKSMS